MYFEITKIHMAVCQKILFKINWDNFKNTTKMLVCCLLLYLQVKN